jgi:hypothetical protein
MIWKIRFVTDQLYWTFVSGLTQQRRHVPAAMPTPDDDDPGLIVVHSDLPVCFPWLSPRLLSCMRALLARFDRRQHPRG